MTQNKEETRPALTLCDFVNFNLPTEELKSTIHNPGSRSRASPALKCSIKRGKKRSTIRIVKEKNQLPVVGSNYKKTESSRMYESIVLSKENSRTFTHKKVTMSELTKCTGQSPKTAKSASTPFHPIKTKLPFFDREMSRTQRTKGYERKKSRITRENSMMSQLFSNYQRFNGEKMDSNLLVSLRNEVIQKQSKRFLLLKNL